MKENGLKMIISAAVAGLSAYLGQLLVPIMVLVCVVILDYATGLEKARRASELNSKRGIDGIIKKLSYFGLVAVGMSVDWLIISGLLLSDVQVGFKGIIALLITAWLIINELISILENLYAIGAPRVPGLDKILKRLKVSAEVLEEDVK
jgi:toxin secretion/phage lysis holin